MGWRQTCVIYNGPECSELAVITPGKPGLVSGRRVSTLTEGIGGAALRQTLPGSAPAVLLWPRSSCSVKRIHLPPADGERLLAALRYELDGQLPFPIEEAALAAYPVEPPVEKSSEPQPVLAFSVRSSEVETVVANLRSVGLMVTRVVPATLALLHSLPAISGAHMHCECRPGDNEVLLMVNNRLAASVWMGERDIPALAAQIRLWWQGLQKAGLANQSTLSLRGVHGDEVQQLGLTLQPHFSQVMLLPAGQMGEVTQAPILRAGATAGDWENATSIELTPVAVKTERENRKRKIRGSVAAVVICVGLVALFGAGRLAITRQEAREEQLMQEWRALSPSVKESSTSVKERDRLLQEAQAWADVLEKRQNWPHILRELSTALPSGVWLTDIRLEQGKSYQMQGNALSSAIAAQFVEGLRNTGIWGEARLDLAKAVDADTETQVSFSIGGTLNAQR